MIKKNEFKKTQFAKKCASFLFNIISDIIKSKGSVSIALSGGKTPFPILKKLIKYEVDWSKVSFIWLMKEMLILILMKVIIII